MTNINETVVRYIADHVMVMYYGEAVEYGTRDAVFANPQHAYTKVLFAATPCRARESRAQTSPPSVSFQFPTICDFADWLCK